MESPLPPYQILLDSSSSDRKRERERQRGRRGEREIEKPILSVIMETCIQFEGSGVLSRVQTALAVASRAPLQRIMQGLQRTASVGFVQTLQFWCNVLSFLLTLSLTWEASVVVISLLRSDIISNHIDSLQQCEVIYS